MHGWNRLAIIALVVWALAPNLRAQEAAPATSPAAPAPAAALSIDEAQVSGVKGWPIGIFGAGFGTAQGKGNVKILGTDATITKWDDTVIEAIVPAVKPGDGQLAVTTGDGKTAQSPFEVYEIDPKFLTRPDDLVNLAYKKPFVIVGEHNDWAGKPSDFLGYNVNRGANLVAPLWAALDLGGPLKEDVWLSFFGGSDWYEGGEIPTAYTIDASADSTDGKDGKWATLETVTDNTRKSRIHKVTLTGQRWIRMNVTAMKVKYFRLSEIRVYKRRAAGAGPLDCIGILGDSITFADLGPTGPGSLNDLFAKAKNDGSVPMTYIMGLIGAGTGGLGLSAKPTDPYALVNALKLTPEMRYFGIAFGTNDSNGPMAAYRKNLNEGVRQLIEAGKVPILARIPDTDPARKGYGSAASKKEAVLITDEIAAKFRLIPGPDFYTPFRQNLTAYVSDGTHHTPAGGAVARQLWVDVFMRSGIYGPRPATTAPATAPAPAGH
jgi:hypothetical protein